MLTLCTGVPQMMMDFANVKLKVVTLTPHGQLFHLNSVVCLVVVDKDHDSIIWKVDIEIAAVLWCAVSSVKNRGLSTHPYRAHVLSLMVLGLILPIQTVWSL